MIQEETAKKRQLDKVGNEMIDKQDEMDRHIQSLKKR